MRAGLRTAVLCQLPWGRLCQSQLNNGFKTASVFPGSQIAQSRHASDRRSSHSSQLLAGIWTTVLGRETTRAPRVRAIPSGAAVGATGSCPEKGGVEVLTTSAASTRRRSSLLHSACARAVSISTWHFGRLHTARGQRRQDDGNESRTPVTTGTRSQLHGGAGIQALRMDHESVGCQGLYHLNHCGMLSPAAMVVLGSTVGCEVSRVRLSVTSRCGDPMVVRVCFVLACARPVARLTP